MIPPRWRCGRSKSATPSWGSTSMRFASSDCKRASPSSRTSRRPSSTPLFFVCRVRRGGHRRTDAAEGRHARPCAHRRRRVDARPILTPGRNRRARVDDLPRYDGGAGRAAARGGLRLARGRRLLPRLQPRTDRPRQSAVHVRQHAEGGLGHRRRVTAAVDRFYSSLVDQTVPVSGRRKPSSPSCSRTRSVTSTSRW